MIALKNLLDSSKNTTWLVI